MSWPLCTLIGAFLVIVGVVIGLAFAAAYCAGDDDQWPDGGAA